LPWSTTKARSVTDEDEFAVVTRAAESHNPQPHQAAVFAARPGLFEQEVDLSHERLHLTRTETRLAVPIYLTE
jgi:hypothetical protein